MTGDSLTFQQRTPVLTNIGAYLRCPSEQILRDIFLATETFVFYIQFLQNSLQYTTNNFPNTARVEFNFQHRLFLPNLFAAHL